MTNAGIDTRISHILGYEFGDMIQLAEWYEWHNIRYVMAIYRKAQLDEAWNVYLTFLDTFLDKP